MALGMGVESIVDDDPSFETVSQVRLIDDMRAWYAANELKVVEDKQDRVVELGKVAHFAEIPFKERLDVASENGLLEFSLYKNAPGNKLDNNNVFGATLDLSYTFEICNHKMLLPIPENDGESYTLVITESGVEFSRDDAGGASDNSLMELTIRPGGPISFITVVGDSTCQRKEVDKTKGALINGMLKIPMGREGYIEGDIEGMPIGGFSFAVLGMSKRRVDWFGHESDGEEVNEDSVGFGPRIGVVADGVGSHDCGDKVSSFFVDSVTQSDEPLFDAIKSAVDDWGFYTSYWKDKNKRPDAVFAAFELKDNGNLDLAHTGDSQWLIIRDRKVIRKSEKRTWVEDLIRKGDITEGQAYEDKKYKKSHNMVSTCLWSVSQFWLENIECDVEFEEGDMLVMITDGLADLSDEEIVEAVWGHSSSQAARNLEDKVVTSNIKDINLVRLKDGTLKKVAPVRDHGSALVLLNEKRENQPSVSSMRLTFNENLSRLVKAS